MADPISLNETYRSFKWVITLRGLKSNFKQILTHFLNCCCCHVSKYDHIYKDGWNGRCCLYQVNSAISVDTFWKEAHAKYEKKKNLYVIVCETKLHGINQSFLALFCIWKLPYSMLLANQRSRWFSGEFAGEVIM